MKRFHPRNGSSVSREALLEVSKLGKHGYREGLPRWVSRGNVVRKGNPYVLNFCW